MLASLEILVAAWELFDNDVTTVANNDNVKFYVASDENVQFNSASEVNSPFSDALSDCKKYYDFCGTEQKNKETLNFYEQDQRQTLMFSHLEFLKKKCHHLELH